MRLKGDEVTLYLSGQPIPVKECNIVITQPKIKEIAAIGEQRFLMAANVFGKMDRTIENIRKDHVEELANYNDLQIFFALLAQDEYLRGCVEDFFELVCPIYVVSIRESDITFSLKDNQDRKVGFINGNNIKNFQDTIKSLFLTTSKDEVDYDPANEAAKRIAEKIQKGKDKVAKQKGGKDTSLFGTYISILSIGMDVDMNSLFMYTPFQLYDSFHRYWDKASYDFYQKVSTTPMMDTSKMDVPKEWTRNLYE